MTPRMVNAIPTANTNLSGLLFGAMFPLLAPACLDQLPSEVCEPLHTSLLVQKMRGTWRVTCDGGHSCRGGGLACYAYGRYGSTPAVSCSCRSGRALVSIPPMIRACPRH